MKKIKKLLIKVWIIKNIVFYYNSIWNHYYFKSKCKEAESRHKLDGKRYFVIPAGEKQLVVVNNDWLKAYNKGIPRNKRITFMQLIEHSYYCTSSKGLNRSIA